MKTRAHETYVKDLRAIHPKIDVLESYVGSKVEITHRHSVCGYQWKSKPNYLLRGYGCPQCGNRPGGKFYSYNKDVANKTKGKVMVVGHYVNSIHKILHACSLCGYEWLASPTNVLSGRSACPECKKRMKRKEKEERDFRRSYRKSYEKILKAQERNTIKIRKEQDKVFMKKVVTYLKNYHINHARTDTCILIFNEHAEIILTLGLGDGLHERYRHVKLSYDDLNNADHTLRGLLKSYA